MSNQHIPQQAYRNGEQAAQQGNHWGPEYSSSPPPPPPQHHMTPPQQQQQPPLTSPNQASTPRRNRQRVPVDVASQQQQQQQQHQTGEFELRSMLPSKWNVPKNHAHVKREKNALRLIGCLPPRDDESPSVLVVTNKPIPIEVLQTIAMDSSTTQQETLVYYFEVTIQKGLTYIGFSASKQLKGPVSLNRWPGDSLGSVGISSQGVCVASGRPLRNAITSSTTTTRAERDTIGCGLEISPNPNAPPQVFFTKNGQVWMSPTIVEDLRLTQDWYFPSVGVAAVGGDVFANFGLSYPFRWKGNAEHVLFSPSQMVAVPTSIVTSGGYQQQQQQQQPPAPTSVAGGGTSVGGGTTSHMTTSTASHAPTRDAGTASSTWNARTGNQQQQQERQPGRDAGTAKITWNVPAGNQQQQQQQQQQQERQPSVEARIDEMRRQQGRRPGLPEEASPRSLSAANRMPAPGRIVEEAPMLSLEDTSGQYKSDEFDVDAKLPSSVPLQQEHLGDSFGSSFSSSNELPRHSHESVGSVPIQSRGYAQGRPAVAAHHHMHAEPPLQQSVAAAPPRQRMQHRGFQTNSSSESIFSSKSDALHSLHESELDLKPPAKPTPRNRQMDGPCYSPNTSSASSSHRSHESSKQFSSPAISGPYGIPSDRHVRLDEDLPTDEATTQFLSSYSAKKAPPDYTGRVGAHHVNEPGAHWVENKTVSLMDPEAIKDVNDCARNLREFCDSTNFSIEVAVDMLEIGRAKQKEIVKIMQEGMIKIDDPKMEVPIKELMDLNDKLLDAIDLANDKLERESAPKVPADAVLPAVDPLPDTQSQGSRATIPAATGSLEIDTLVNRKDIFSLICMLRTHGDKRLDAAMALMIFVREAEQKQSLEAIEIRNEISSSGGMHSLLALFRSRGAARELKVVAALAIAYLLPSFVRLSAATSTSIGLKIVECLRFLYFSPNPVTPRGEEISRAEMCRASAIGVHTYWIYILSQSLSRKSEPSSVSPGDDSEQPVERPSLRMRRSRAMMLQQTGETVFDQRRETLELQELLELTVSLIVEMAKTSDRTDTSLQVRHSSTNSVPLVEQMSAIVQQMCAIDKARPIAVREGLLGVLVTWMRSHDREKIQCAALSVNGLTSTRDSYMAGWIHSQIVNEGALKEIVTLLVSKSVGPDVRLAVAEILRRLCVAPHTRAAVVESECVRCLIGLLYDFEDSFSQKVAFAAGSALLQLVAGAMTRSSIFSSGDFEADDSASVSADKRDDVISDVVDGGAILQFVAMAQRSPRGKLRSMSVETLRVLSEDTNRSRRTRLRLCEDGAAGALGHIVKDDVKSDGSIVVPMVQMELDEGEHKGASSMSAKDITIQELHQSLCTWSNILDHDSQASGGTFVLTYQTSTAFRFQGSEEILVKGCIEFVEAGGLQSLLKIATLPLGRSGQNTSEGINESDLVVEASRSLASMSPLLLSSTAASRGYASWSVVVLQALTKVLDNVSKSDRAESDELSTELKFDALRGIGALAAHEPHKLTIVDKFLPSLFHTKNGRGDDPIYISGAAGHVCASLGLSDDDFAKKIAGNDPKLMGDWFCMQRSLLLQSMARTEALKVLSAVWEKPFHDILVAGQVPSDLWRSTSKDSQRSKDSSVSSGQLSNSRSESGGEPQTLEDVFECLTFGVEGLDARNTVLEQYHDVYEKQVENGRDPFASDILRIGKSNDTEAESLLSSHVYPLDSTATEREWVLSHRRFVKDGIAKSAVATSGRLMSAHVQHLMDSCIPSRLIQHSTMPIFDLRPEALFDFRSLVMPQRRYFSFRREGQLVSQLCDTNASFVESDDVHWTLAFTNSSFAGEFSETLVQALYRCPMIRGISFTRNDNWRSVWGDESEDEGQATSTLFANVAGSLPPWVSSVIYDNTLNDFSLAALAEVLETMGRLSGTSANAEEARDLSQLGQQQGSFQSFAVVNSPHLGSAAWNKFFDLLGRSPSPDRSSSLKAHPLDSLRILDLSGNNLGDNTCSAVLARVLSKKSGCCLEQLNLSRNGIRKGSQVAKVLCNYVDQYRSNQSAGVYVTKESWRSPLAYLDLSSNELSTGRLALEVVVLLKNNALSLKSLDMSDNGLECQGYEFTQVLLGSLVKNTSLRHLNLSGNEFSYECIDKLLDGLTRSDTDSSLAFLRLDDNSPPLTDSQHKLLHDFEVISRTFLLRRYLNDRERMKSGELDDIDAPDDGPMATLREDQPSYAPRPSLERKTSDFSGSMFSGSDAMTASEEGSTRRSSRDRRSSLGTKGENMITVLFSAPLVFQDSEDKYHPFAKLDFDMERELLWQCLKEARRDIELFFDNATHHRLLAAKTKRCGCLHYSGHGHETHLPFENGKGGPHWLEVDVLKNLLEQDEGAPFKFVFVSACHSGLAGETFASAGVPHVVCCQQNSELKDAAALAFTRQFYLALAVGETVKKSFEQGCRAVRATPNLRNAEKEMKKFVLLPKDGNHDVPIFVDAKRVREWPRTASSSGSTRNLQRRSSRRKLSMLQQDKNRSIYLGGTRSSELSVRNMMQEDPSPTPPQFFIGREVDMYHVLNSVLNKRLVSVVGEKGLGRSSLVYALCHYVNERRSTILEIEHIYFVRATQNRGSNRFVAVLRELLKKLMQDGRIMQQTFSEMDMETLIHAICKALNKAKALLVIDRTEFLEGSDEQQDLVVFLSNLFQESKTQHVRVLLTGREPLGVPSIGGVPEQPYYLGPMNFQNTVRLFSNLCPHLHTPADRRRFIQRVVTDDKQSNLLPTDKDVTERTSFLFHALGDGVPSRIEKAAYSISGDSLERLGSDDEVASAVTW